VRLADFAALCPLISPSEGNFTRRLRGLHTRFARPDFNGTRGNAQDSGTAMRRGNIFKRRSNLRLKLLFGLLLGGLLLASVVRADEPAGEMPLDCALADTAISKRLQPGFDRRVASAALPMGDIVSLLNKARSFCLDSQPDRGMVIYFRISDVVGGALAAQLDAERRRR